MYEKLITQPRILRLFSLTSENWSYKPIDIQKVQTVYKMIDIEHGGIQQPYRQEERAHQMSTIVHVREGEGP